MSAAANTRSARMEVNGGSHSEYEWQAQLRHQRHRCGNPFCLQDLSALGVMTHRDHIVPIARGGTNNIKNIKALCGPCNLRKHAKPWQQFLAEEGQRAMRAGDVYGKEGEHAAHIREAARAAEEARRKAEHDAFWTDERKAAYAQSRRDGEAARRAGQAPPPPPPGSQGGADPRWTAGPQWRNSSDAGASGFSNAPSFQFFVGLIKGAFVTAGSLLFFMLILIAAMGNGKRRGSGLGRAAQGIGGVLGMGALWNWAFRNNTSTKAMGMAIGSLAMTLVIAGWMHSDYGARQETASSNTVEAARERGRKAAEAIPASAVAAPHVSWSEVRKMQAAVPVTIAPPAPVDVRDGPAAIKPMPRKGMMPVAPPASTEAIPHGRMVERPAPLDWAARNQTQYDRNWATMAKERAAAMAAQSEIQAQSTAHDQAFVAQAEQAPSPMPSAALHGRRNIGCGWWPVGSDADRDCAARRAGNGDRRW